MLYQDFRSSDGLYALVKQQHPDVVLKGRDLFDASLFRDKTSTAVFYTFISQLKHRIDSATPTPTHYFIKTLDTKQKLLRSYTQNIDGLEEKVGLRSSPSQAGGSGKGKSRLKAAEVRNVQLHGDIHRVRCTLCSLDLPWTKGFQAMFDQGLAPECPECRLRCESLASGQLERVLTIMFPQRKHAWLGQLDLLKSATFARESCYMMKYIR